jgi:arylformamidase
MDIAAEAFWPRAQIDADYTARNCTTEADFTRIIADYARLSRKAETSLGGRLNLLYDKGSAETLNLFGAGDNRPVFLFIHGGYWRALSKEHSAFMAPMLAAQGIATAVPDYTLAPGASLAEITRQMRAAFAFLWHNAPDLGLDRSRIFVGGSSAGGHLAAALAMPGWQGDFGLPESAVRGALPISGLYDLAPIAASHVQDWMQLSDQDIQALSPLRHTAGTARSLIAVAEHEVSGFHRQSAAYATALGAPFLTVPGRNHFDVILDLTKPDTALSKALLGLIQR